VRIALVVVVLLVLAGIGVGIAFALGGSGGGSGSKGGSGGRHAAKHAKAAGTAVRNENDKAAADPAGSASPAASTSPAASGSPKTTATSGAPKHSASAVPAGYHRYTSPEGFSIALPDGWHLVGGNGYGSGSVFAGPGGAKGTHTRLQIDWTGKPGTDAAANWRSEESAVKGKFPGYHRVRLTAVDYRGYRTAADWEFTYTSGGTTMHALNRGFVTDAHHGYAIYLTAPDSGWHGGHTAHMLQTFLKTFKPAG
jgi:hypothetical protein